MQNTSTGLKGGDELETQSWTHDGNNYSTHIYFTKRFYGVFSISADWPGQPYSYIL